MRPPTAGDQSVKQGLHFYDCGLCSVIGLGYPNEQYITTPHLAYACIADTHFEELLATIGTYSMKNVSFSAIFSQFGTKRARTFVTTHNFSLVCSNPCVVCCSDDNR